MQHGPSPGPTPSPHTGVRAFAHPKRDTCSFGSAPAHRHAAASTSRTFLQRGQPVRAHAKLLKSSLVAPFLLLLPGFIWPMLRDAA